MARSPHILLAMTLVGIATMLAASLGSQGRAAEGLLGPVTSRHPELRAALDRIARGSASWRAALTALQATGRHAVVVTPDDVVVQDPTGETAAFDRSDVAAIAPATNGEGHVSAVVVVINVEQIQAAHDRLSSLPGEFHADLERILAHEVYGHAVPLLLAGHLSGRCADPAPGEAAAAACAIQRENVIRAELRLGRRTDAALASLALARAVRH